MKALFRKFSIAWHYHLDLAGTRLNQFNSEYFPPTESDLSSE